MSKNKVRKGRKRIEEYDLAFSGICGEDWG